MALGAVPNELLTGERWAQFCESAPNALQTNSKAGASGGAAGPSSSELEVLRCQCLMKISGAEGTALLKGVDQCRVAQFSQDAGTYQNTRGIFGDGPAKEGALLKADWPRASGLEGVPVRRAKAPMQPLLLWIGGCSDPTHHCYVPTHTQTVWSPA